MTSNFKATYNVKHAVHAAVHGDNECGFCGTPCDEQDDFCSPRCERNAQGGKQKAAKKVGWDG